CGDGLADPNFGALLKWSAEVLGPTIYRHYCLCRNGERAALQAKHPPSERLFFIGYGDDYKDLAPFLLKHLARAPKHQLPPPGRCIGREREVADVVSTLIADSP